MDYPEVIKMNHTYVKLPLGSVYRWMYQDWFDKAISLDLIRKDPYGIYRPVAIEREIEIPVEKRGRQIITKKEKIVDYTAFRAFAEAYEKYDYKVHEEDLSNEQRIKQFNLPENLMKKMPSEMSDYEQSKRKEELLKQIK